MSQFARNPQTPAEHAVLDGGRIEAPASGQSQELLCIGRWPIDRGVDRRGGFAITEAAHSQLNFVVSDRSLVPEGFTGPGIGSADMPTIGSHPGMVIDHAVGAEKLDL